MSELTSLIVLNCVNLAVNLMVPLIVAIAYFIMHIKKSNCCGSAIEVRSPREGEAFNALNTKHLADKANDPSLEEFKIALHSVSHGVGGEALTDKNLKV